MTETKKDRVSGPFLVRNKGFSRFYGYGKESNTMHQNKSTTGKAGLKALDYVRIMV